MYLNLNALSESKDGRWKNRIDAVADVQTTVLSEEKLDHIIEECIKKTKGVKIHSLKP